MSIRLAQKAAAAYAYPLLIKQLLHTPLATAPCQEIVYRDRVRYTYRTLMSRIGRLANALSALGVEPGTTVAVMDWDSHRYLECYYAVPMMGAVLQTVNVRLSIEQILYTLDHAGAEVLLVHRDFLPLLCQLLGKLIRVKVMILLEEAPESWPDQPRFAGEYEALLGRAEERFEFTDFDERAVATTFYTTGTTGLPKAVEFTHRQIVLHTLAVLGAFASAPHGQSFRQGDVYMPLTPMFHVHAWGLPYVATVLGVKQVYPGRYEPSALLALRRDEGVTYSHCVPRILQMLLEAPGAADTDLSGWKFTIGGSALPAGLAQRAMDRGIHVFAAYGMSETCPVLTAARVTPGESDDPVTHPESLRKAGPPIPLVDLRVVDENMQDLARDGTSAGEIVVRAPWLTMGYRGDALASEGLWRGGYLHTRDVGTIDAEGCLEVRDRLKDVIKSGGEWICSLQLEDLISRHPAVAEVAVIAVPDETWGERPLALIVAKPEHRHHLTEADIRTHLEQLARAGLIARYAIPEHARFVDALERTGVGKLNKQLMRERFAPPSVGEPNPCN
jgi:fatty-acyl-CoA synthase